MALRRIVYCSGGYVLFSRVLWMFRGIIGCTGGLIAVQVGYMDGKEGHMIKKIMKWK